MLVLKEIRANIDQAFGPGKQIVLLADNARTHRAEDVQKLAASPEVNIQFIWNLVARPDIGTLGIERSRYQSSLIIDLFILIVWARAKDLYRKEVDRLKVYNRQYSNQGLVETIMRSITDDYAKKCASLSFPAI